MGSSTMNVAPCPSPLQVALTVARTVGLNSFKWISFKAQPAMLPLCRSIGLAEPLENIRQEMGSLFPHRCLFLNYHVGLHNLGKHLNFAAFGRELDRVHQEVPKHLLGAGLGRRLEDRQVGHCSLDISRPLRRVKFKIFRYSKFFVFLLVSEIRSV